ncbi:MAG: CoA transferase [Acidimicrobiaceae bacterium]|jgi:itaconate CoA-transferase|nr:CoA transferase [Acidimicrobiaceae bacterium]MCO4835278.1 CoA transferase [Acidimicrobiaceae bacterium]MDB4103114.1 CoA transferase [Acidimicrobiales bacterium]
MTTLPLTGLTVVAVEQAVAAPLCTARLVDAGARVIKIERADGDFARGYDDAAHGDSSYFAWANQGKESLVLDIKDPNDAALLHAILDQADVFVQNLAPGALERAGFGSDALRDRNQRLITCDISGYGESAEVADKKAYDLLVQAESGLIGISGSPNELGRIGVSMVDAGTGMTAYYGVLEAIIQRGVTGKGSGVRVSLFDVAADWMTVPLAQHDFGAGGPTRVGLKHPTIAPYGAFETSDGSLTLISIQNEREWVRLCEQVLVDTAIAIDSRFNSNTNRVANRDALESQMNSIIGALSRAQFQARLTEASIAYGNVSSLADLSTHPALRRRTVHTSTGQTVELPAHPVRWTELPGMAERQSGRVPTIGEHNAAIRAEFG